MNDELPKKWVAGICIKDNKVLLVHRINKERLLNQEYFLFPGRNVNDDESVEDALINEFKDFSVHVALQDLLYSKEEDGNEVEYYYLCEHKQGDPLLAKNSEEASIMDEGEQFYTPMWVPLNELDELVVHPESVKVEVIERYAEGV